MTLIEQEQQQVDAIAMSIRWTSVGRDRMYRCTGRFKAVDAAEEESFWCDARMTWRPETPSPDFEGEVSNRGRKKMEALGIAGQWHAEIRDHNFRGNTDLLRKIIRKAFSIRTIKDFGPDETQAARNSQ